ncbi:MAG: LLM class flavin-dependent oxidoreductase [Chloroflexota bacterium]|nr:LLM class flavin-dependent oxidoreductase [Chloroflexota bacterium]
MAQHPWVAEMAEGPPRFGVQLVLPEDGLARLPETARFVESLGFDALFIFDHPALHPDPWVCLTAAAVATKRIRLGSAVNCVPYRHPTHLARLAADLDQLSHGRLLLGLGAGWLEPEFRALDVPFLAAPERLAALSEAIEIIQGVWGPEKFSYAGTYFRTEAMRVTPPPVQQPRPAFIIGGGGERLTLRLVARHGDACNINELALVEGKQERVGGTDTIRHKLAVLRDHCADAGRSPDEVLRTHFTIRLVLAASESALIDKLARQSAAPSASPGTRRAGATAALTGTPVQILTYYQEMAAAGLQYFVVQLAADDVETLELLATEIMPRLA